MLQDLDSTLEKIIYTVGKINRTEVDIAFDQPNRDWSARLSRPTVNLWGYDLRENVKLRSSQRTVNTADARKATVSKPPRRIDISYWVTAWARKIEDEHQLLWRTLGALKRTHSINPREAEGTLRYSTIEIPITVADMNDHQMNMADLWGVLDNSMRLGFLLVVTLELDLEIAIDTPLVLEKTLRFGQSEDPESERFSAKDTEFIQKGDPSKLPKTTS
jgi:hypothetical protein